MLKTQQLIFSFIVLVLTCFLCIGSYVSVYVQTEEMEKFERQAQKRLSSLADGVNLFFTAIDDNVKF